MGGGWVVGGWMGGCMDRWVGVWMSDWMDGWVDEQIKEARRERERTKLLGERELYGEERHLFPVSVAACVLSPCPQ